MPGKYQELIGAVHIHSNFSDGTKSIEDIAAIANTVGLDYIMISDHNTLEPLHQGLEGFYDNTAVLIGYEINDPDDRNHYLAFGLDEVLLPEQKPDEYVRQVKQKNGLGIIAHPDEIRMELAKYPGYPWTAWHVDGYDGIEIWNHMSQWMESLSRWNMLKQAFMPRRALKSPTRRILQIWDKINLKRKVVGIGSLDVHAYPYRLGPLRITIFPYKVQFKAIRTHILMPSPVSDGFNGFKHDVYKALKDCRAFISNYRWGDARGFEFYAENSSGSAYCGEELSWEKLTVLNVKFSKSALLKLLRNGDIIFTGNGAEFEIAAPEPGLYRVEVYIQNKGWIFSNHIRLLDTK